MNIFGSIILLMISSISIAGSFEISDRITSTNSNKYDDLKFFDWLRWVFLGITLTIMAFLGAMAYLGKLELSEQVKKILTCLMIVMLLCNAVCFTISGIINDTKLNDSEKISKLNGIVLVCSTISGILIGFIVAQFTTPLVLLIMTIFAFILWSGFYSNLSIEPSQKCFLSFTRQSLFGSILCGLVIGYSISYLVSPTSKAPSEKIDVPKITKE